MHKKQQSIAKLNHTNSVNSEHGISSKLFSLTGLRVFQPKFIEDLYHPQQKNINHQLKEQSKENPITTSKPQLMKNQKIPILQPIEATIEKKIDQTQFSGKDKKNQQKTPIKQIPIKEKQIVKLKTVTIRGLNNIGNTCYMNSIIQCLFQMDQFNNAFENELLKLKSLSNRIVSKSYISLWQQALNSQNFSLTPSTFKSSISKRKSRFYGSSQQDAQELLTAFFESVNLEMNRVTQKAPYKQLSGNPLQKSIKDLSNQWWNYYKKRDDSLIGDYFQGQLISTTACKKCKTQSISFDNIWALPLDISKDKTIKQSIQHNWIDNITINDYHCQNCKTIRICNRNCQLFRLPQILVIQLKRFSFGKLKRQKIKDSILISEMLDLNFFMNQHSEEKKTKYELRGIVNHFGQINYGHYTATVKSKKDKKWYQMNDQSFSETKFQSESRYCYLLFYEQM